MARYVDFENTGALAEAMHNLFSKCHLNYKVGCFADDCQECIRRFLSPYGSGHLLPAADVRPERHGKNTTEMNSVDEFVCSECGFIMRETSGYDKEEDVYYEFDLKFCPNCGAKMDREDGNK